jgi:hypothetical protein
LTFEKVDFIDRVGTKAFVIASSTDITLRRIHVDGVETGDYGTGTGLWISKNHGFTLENSLVQDFKTGLWIQSTTDLTVSGNTIRDISLDGMIVGRVHDAYFIDNHVSLHVPAGTKHSDGMQFYNSEVNDPISNMVVRDNLIETNNRASHGIYLANGLADDTGRPATFFQDLIIKKNTVVSGQVSGIAVGQTDGLSVYANVILQDPDFRSTREIDIPVIRVHADSTDVGITANTTHRTPEPSGENWFPTDRPEPEWTIESNRIVPIGTEVADVSGAASASAAAAAELDATLAAIAVDTAF